MLKNAYHTGLVVLLTFVPFLFVHATGHGGGGGSTPSCQPGRLCNPLKQENIYDFLVAMLEIVMFIAVPIIVFFIIYAGFLFVTAAGNVDKLGTAKKTLMWALVGAVVLLGAWIIAQAVQGTVEQIIR